MLSQMFKSTTIFIKILWQFIVSTGFTDQNEISSTKKLCIYIASKAAEQFKTYHKMLKS